MSAKARLHHQAITYIISSLVEIRRVLCRIRNFGRRRRVALVDPFLPWVLTVRWMVREATHADDPERVDSLAKVADPNGVDEAGERLLEGVEGA